MFRSLFSSNNSRTIPVRAQTTLRSRMPGPDKSTRSNDPNGGRETASKMSTPIAATRRRIRRRRQANPRRDRHLGRDQPRGSIRHVGWMSDGGGWNTPIPRRTGRIAVASQERKEDCTEFKRWADEDQGQESIRTSVTPAGTAGTSGCPEQNAPEQGRDGGRSGSRSEGATRSRTKDSVSAEDSGRLVRDVTRCEQPACARVAQSQPSPGTPERLLPESRPVAGR